MNKHIKSSDPRKSRIAAAIKQLSGGTKVTMVRQTGPNTFAGSALRKNEGRGWENLGTFEVSLEIEGERNEA